MEFKDLFLKFKNSLKENKENKETNKINKRIINLIIIVLIGAILMIAGSSFKGNKNNTISAASANKENTEEKKYVEVDAKEYEMFLQNELKNKLEKVQGVGRVDVMIYFESGEEKVPAVNMTNSNSITNEQDTAGGKRKISQNNNDKNVVVTNENGDNKPLIIKKNKPRVTGVLVVAEGAEDKITELRISKAVCALFNIPNNKVNVYPMKK